MESPIGPGARISAARQQHGARLASTDRRGPGDLSASKLHCSEGTGVPCDSGDPPALPGGRRPQAARAVVAADAGLAGSHIRASDRDAKAPILADWSA